MYILPRFERRVDLATKRKDKNGRILKDGESQRPNGTYMYRYYDIYNNRKSIYAKTLAELRAKENEIMRDASDEIDYAAGKETVSDLVLRYMSLKRDLKMNSKKAYNSVIRRIQRDPFGLLEIRVVRISTAKKWFVDLYDSGVKYNTIGVIQSVVRPAFEMAVEDDVIRKNPFKFKLSDILKNNQTKREALTKEQEYILMDVVKKYGRSYYDEIVILLGTGLRVSELYGLTKSDIDMKNRQIRVNKQLFRRPPDPYCIGSPKTKSGIRTIPMTDKVYEAFCRVLKNRKAPKVESIIDGHTGFLFLDKNGRPKVSLHMDLYLQRIMKLCEREGIKLPRVTPHVLRHTFCTNAQRGGIDVKSLQYFMGHSSASVTLDVYSHIDYGAAKLAFDKVAPSL